MGSGIFFPLSALPFSILIMILFFQKEQAKNIETKIYKFLLVSNFIGLIIDILCTYASIIYTVHPFISEIIYKSYLLYLLTWTSFFTYYVYRISTINLPNINSGVKKLIIAFCVLIITFVFFLPIEVVIKNDFQTRYTTGLSVFYTYIVSGIIVFIMSLILLKNRKNIKKKKYIPVLVFFIVGTFAIILQFFRPELLIITYIETLICIIMYFTIENPDLKILNELYRNKELMEQNYEDKYNFLFEITQEARNPIVNINKVCSELKSIDLPVIAKEKVDNLYNLTRQLDFSINGILNISSLDIQKLKIINSKYEIDKLCNDLKIRIKPELKDNVNFQIFIPKQLPLLYGDYMKIRQILYSLLTNSCKNTSNGNINLRVNLIEKYDVCRVIYSISDTGKGMPIDKINDILSATGELDKNELEILEKKEYNFKVCQKVAKIMGGNIMIKSSIDAGTEVIFTIDQRVYHEEEQSILTKYENSITNYRKVLLVSQRKNMINLIKKRLSDNKITCSNFYYTMDAIDRIKSGRKFDFIIIDDEMAEMSGIMSLNKLKELKNFDIPVIIMLDNGKEKIKEHYLEDGFNDYILVDNLDNGLDKIIDKY